MSPLPMRRAAAALLMCLMPLAAAAPQAATDAPLAALPYAAGLDRAAMDTSADPCADFYRYACGGWQRDNPIPPDRDSWSVYAKLQEENERFLWGLLLAAAHDQRPRTPAEQKIGDHFAACVDEAAIESAGLAPIAPALERIAALGSVQSIAPLVARLHLAGAAGVLFAFDADQDFGDASRVIGIASAAGLGLPDRDLYLKRDPRSIALRDAYVRHVARLLTLAGDAPIAAQDAARTVLAIETAFARASLSRVQQRDPRRLYHPMTPARLQRIAPAFDWSAYRREAGLAASTTPINVSEPAFFRALSKELTRRPLRDWQAYLRWHLLHAHAPHLHAAVAGEHFDFFSKTLRGIERPPPRWRQCVRWVDRDLGEALGEVFVRHAFAPATKARAAEMARRVVEAMDQRIRRLDWMSGSTKQAALRKLATLATKIGYPERWRDYAALEVRRGDFFGNVERAFVFETRRDFAKIGRPVDRDEWGMTPPSVNAYYSASMNEMNFPAGILQPPLFDPAMDDAPNYGNTGSTIGHELTHGFDDEGRRFDEHGNLRDWWTARDAAEFDRRAACVAEQYSGYTVVDDIKIDGRLTLGEDVADLGGTVLAYAAWQAAVAGQPLAPRDGLAPEQRFFVGMAQWACSNERPEALRLRALTDVHSPNRHRVNGVLANMPEFARAFLCKPGAPMVRTQPCRVW